MKCKLLYLTLIVALAIGCAEPPTGDVADTVYTNGRVYTVNEAQPWAEAVAIKDGKFLAVGSNDDIQASAGESTQVVDLGGKFVMPGIVDMHAHPFTGVDMGTGGVNLDSPGDPEAILADIKDRGRNYFPFFLSFWISFASPRICSSFSWPRGSSTLASAPWSPPRTSWCSRSPARAPPTEPSSFAHKGSSDSRS